MSKETLELKIIHLWRKHHRVCKPRVWPRAKLGPGVSTLLGQSLFHCLHFSLSPAFAELSYMPVRGTLKIRRNDIQGIRKNTAT